jgi:hypothetical protein
MAETSDATLPNGDTLRVFDHAIIRMRPDGSRKTYGLFNQEQGTIYLSASSYPVINLMPGGSGVTVAMSSEDPAIVFRRV